MPRDRTADWLAGLLACWLAGGIRTSFSGDGEPRISSGFRGLCLTPFAHPVALECRRRSRPSSGSCGVGFRFTCDFSDGERRWLLGSGGAGRNCTHRSCAGDVGFLGEPGVLPRVLYCDINGRALPRRSTLPTIGYTPGAKRLSRPGSLHVRLVGHRVRQQRGRKDSLEKLRCFRVYTAAIYGFFARHYPVEMMSKVRTRQRT